MSSSFGTFEPSDALLQAIQSRVSAKNFAERISGSQSNEAAPPPSYSNRETTHYQQHDAVLGDVPVQFKLAGGGMKEAASRGSEAASAAMATHTAPHSSAYQVAGHEGISFRPKEASQSLAGAYHAPSTGSGAGSMFRLAGVEEEQEVEAPTPQAASSSKGPRSSASSSHEQPRGPYAPGAPPPKKEQPGRAASHATDARPARGPSPRSAAAGPKKQAAPQLSQMHHETSSVGAASVGSARGSRSVYGSTPSKTAAASPAAGSYRSTNDEGNSSRPQTGGGHSARSGSAPRMPDKASMENVADQALARAMASVGFSVADENESEPAETTGIPHGYPPQQAHANQHGPYVARLPSAVTVAGVPVAADGDLVYLGGGLYASAVQAREPERKPQKPPSKGLPGRARPLPPRPMKGSAVRSASAHLVGPQSSSAFPGEFSPSMSRAQSDGQLGLGGTGMTGLSMPMSGQGGGHGIDSARGPPQHGSVAGSVAASVGSSGPKAWRPSGVQKLPQAKLEPPLFSKPSRLSPEEAGQMPGAHSDARREERNQNRKQNQGFFGQNGVLNQLRESEMDDAEDSMSRAWLGPRGVGPPQSSVQREAERKAVKEMKIQQLLDERELRLATEAAETAQKRNKTAWLARNAANATSAPDLLMQFGRAPETEDELEEQRQRVASKMQMLDFFNGYGKSVKKMTADQTAKVLLASMQQNRDQRHGRPGEQKNGKAEEQREAGLDGPSIQGRLQQVNDQCNKVFEEADLEEP